MRASQNALTLLAEGKMEHVQTHWSYIDSQYFSTTNCPIIDLSVVRNASLPPDSSCLICNVKYELERGPKRCISPSNVKEKYMFLQAIQFCLKLNKVCLDSHEPPKSSSEHSMVKLYVCTEWSYLNHNQIASNTVIKILNVNLKWYLKPLTPFYLLITLMKKSLIAFQSMHTLIHFWLC